MRVLIVVAAAASLMGCENVPKADNKRIDAQNQYEAWTEKYIDCVRANPAAPQQCKGQRLLMEEWERKANSAATAQGR
jgi:hypothetical protein